MTQILFKNIDMKGLTSIGVYEKQGGYQSLKKLTSAELNNLPILLRGAAIRILLTRLHDQIYHPKEAYVKPKNPMEYFTILKFHQSNNFIG